MATRLNKAYQRGASATAATPAASQANSLLKRIGNKDRQSEGRSPNSKPKPKPKPKPKREKKGTPEDKAVKQRRQQEKAQKKNKPPKEADWLKSDPGHIRESADLQAEYARFLAELDASEKNYDTDFNTSMRNLGFAGGAWNEADRTSQYGQTMRNQMEDFAGRGLRDSTFFLDARGDAQTNFDRQLADRQSQRQRTVDDFSNQRTTAEEQLQAALERARLDALARYAAQFGLG